MAMEASSFDKKSASWKFWAAKGCVFSLWSKQEFKLASLTFQALNIYFPGKDAAESGNLIILAKES